LSVTPGTPRTPGVRITRLPNGIRVVTETLPWARSVATGFRVGVGARDESAELAGASHFLEHLLFEGTETRSASQIAETVEAVGGEMNAHTGREDTAYYTRLPSGHLTLGLDILSDVILAPAFRPSEIEAERQVILSVASSTPRPSTLPGLPTLRTRAVTPAISPASSLN